MQDETQIPGAAAQESNNVPDPGATASPGGSEGLGQGFSGEDPTAIPTPTIQGVSGVSAFEPAASVGAEEAWSPFSPTELDPEVAPALMIGRAEPLAPEGPSAASLRTYSNG
jgi:hypothetical protein